MVARRGNFNDLIESLIERSAVTPFVDKKRFSKMLKTLIKDLENLNWSDEQGIDYLRFSIEERNKFIGRIKRSL